MFKILAAMIGMVAGEGRAAPLRVDLNPDNHRGDVVTPWAENWAFDPARPSRTFGGISVSLSSPSPMTVRWYKPLLVHGATFTSDGVVSQRRLEIAIAGLTPGRHSLSTYHNRLDEGEPPAYNITIGGGVRVSGLRPTTRVHNDADSAIAYVEFEAESDPVVVAIVATGGDGAVILNGFEIDAPDPNRKAIKPSPADGDGHVDADSGSTSLSWTSRTPAARHELYVGESREAVEAAGRSSPEFRGDLTTAAARVDAPSGRRDTYWRVDEVADSGEVDARRRLVVPPATPRLPGRRGIRPVLARRAWRAGDRGDEPG